MMTLFKTTMIIITSWNQRVLDEWAQVVEILLEKLPYHKIQSELEETAL